MQILALFAPVIAYFTREVIAKFFVFTAVFGIVAILIPKIVQAVIPYVSDVAFTSAFSAISPGVWFFLDFFNLGFGLPLLISAWITRFLIRRLPVVG